MSYLLRHSAGLCRQHTTGGCTLAARAKTLLLLFFLCAALLLCAAFPARAAGWPELSTAIQSDGAILIDADSGVMLYGKNQDEAYYPASITKVMTAIIVLENAGSLDEMVTFSNDAVNTNLEENATIIGASAGDKLSVRDCLYSLLLHSANDAANALAEHIAGSNEAFAELMNQKAAELGCTNTHFDNPSGLNSPEHYTSCSDMAKIMAYAIKNPQFRQIDQTQYYTHAPIKRYPDPDDPVNTVYAHHKMMRKNAREYYPGVFAGKTGYTMAAGNTLVTACERDGMTLICVILNGHQSQYTDSKALFDYGYASFASLSVSENDALYGALDNKLAVDGIPLTDMLTLQIDEAARITLPKTAAFQEASAALDYELSGDDEAPAGAFAKLSYSYEGREVGSAYVRLVDGSAQRAAGNRCKRCAAAVRRSSSGRSAGRCRRTGRQHSRSTAEATDRTGRDAEQRAHQHRQADRKAGGSARHHKSDPDPGRDPGAGPARTACPLLLGAPRGIRAQTPPRPHPAPHQGPDPRAESPSRPAPKPAAKRQAQERAAQGQHIFSVKKGVVGR